MSKILATILLSVFILVGSAQGQRREVLNLDQINAQLDEEQSIVDYINELQFIIDSLQLENFSISESIYGHKLFRSDSIKIFQTATISKIPENYVLGIGDEITISVFGESQFDAKYIIDEKGYIQPLNMPKIFLKGLRWVQARDLITQRFDVHYIFSPEQIAINITAPRKVTINVFGNVNRPGTYSLPATNTAFNALVAAGGPKPLASVRNIKITAGSEQKFLDIYELMENPIKQFDYYLVDNSIIHVPFARKLVTLEGEFKRTLDYELKDSEGLKELMQFGGYFTPQAVKEKLNILRYTDQGKVLLEASQADFTSRSIPLYNGDVVIARTANEEILNQVFVTGAVTFEGAYSLSATPDLKSLIEKSRPKKDANKGFSFLYRENNDKSTNIVEVDLNDVESGNGGNIDLMPNDTLFVPSLSEQVNYSDVIVEGEVLEPRTIPFDPDSSLTVQKAVLISGGLLSEAMDFGFIQRTSRDDSNKKSYINVDIKRAMQNPGSSYDLKLHEKDKLIILKNSENSEQFYLTISGAVRHPKQLFFDENMSITDMINLSGGLKYNASGTIHVYRLVLGKSEESRVIAETLVLDKNYNVIKGNKDFKFEPNDKIVAQESANIDINSLVKLSGEIKFPGPYGLTSKNQNLSDLLNRAGGLTKEAFAGGIRIHRKNKMDYKAGEIYEGQEVQSDTTVTKYYKVILNNKMTDLSLRNQYVIPGDSIHVPKKLDVVEIYINNTKVRELYPELDSISKIAASHLPGKSAKWYIDNIMGGVSDEGDYNSIFVEYPNGQISKPSKFLFFKKHPKVENGSKIFVGQKEEEEDDPENNNGLVKRIFPKSVKGVVIYENGTSAKPKTVETKNK